MNGEVDVDRLLFDGVMPVVVARADQQTFEEAKAEAQVGMHECRQEVDEQEVRIQGRLAKAQDKHWDDRDAT
jgi:hypothetical protein